MGELVWEPYIPVVCRHLQAAFEGKIGRLSINLPPGVLKSTLVSCVFPAWVWSQTPGAGIVSVGYDDGLAKRDASDSRDLMRTEWYRSLWPEVTFRDDTDAKGYYRLTQGGWRMGQTYKKRLTGDHPVYFIWDDPLKAIDAHNASLIKELRDWYFKTVSTRGKARTVVDDTGSGVSSVRHILCGQHLSVSGPLMIPEEQNAIDTAEGREGRWHIVKFPMRYDPAIAMPDRGFGGEYRTEPGQLLDPLRLPESTVADMEMDLGNDAHAQLQQNPVEVQGTMFKADNLIEIDADEVPADLDEVVRFFDKAATKDGGCQTAGVLIGKHSRQIGEKSVFNPPKIHYYILDDHSGHWDVDRVEDEIVLCKDADLAVWGFDRYRLAIEEEGGSGGKVSVRSTEKRMQGVQFEAISPVGNKEARATPLAREVRLGNVYIVRGSWTPAFKTQMRQFPNGKLKDKIDAAAGAHLCLEGTIGTKNKKKGALVSRPRTNVICVAAGCDRPIESGSDYCCPECEVVSGFNDPTMTVDHSDGCCGRYFRASNS